MTQYPTTSTGGEPSTTEQVREQATEKAEVVREKARDTAQQARGHEEGYPVHQPRVQ